MSIQNWSRKKLVIAGGITAVIILVVVLALTRSKSNQPEGQTPATQIPQVAVTPSGITYPSSWQEAAEIAVSEKDSGVTSVATKGQPTTKVIIREVNGELASDFDIQKLPDQIGTELGAQIEGFTLIEKRTMKMGENNAVRVEYKQLNSSDQKIYQFVMFVVPTAKKTFYITYSSAEDIAKLSGDIDKINQSIAQYIKTHPS